MLRTQSGPSTLSSQGALLPRGVCPDTSVSRVHPGWGQGDRPWQRGPQGPRQGAVQQWDKAIAVSLPQAMEHACPILVPLNGQLCARDVDPIVLLCGLIQAHGQGRLRPREEPGAPVPEEKGP